jgi:hypothetical protein
LFATFGSFVRDYWNFCARLLEVLCATAGMLVHGASPANKSL